MSSVVTYTDWNSYGLYYPDMDSEDKLEYMVGAQANGYVKWFKSNLIKWHTWMEQQGEDIGLEEATGQIEMWKGQERIERTAMIGRLCEKLEIESIDILPSDSGRVGMPEETMESLEERERMGLQKIGSMVDVCTNVFVGMLDDVGQHRKRAAGKDGFVVDPNVLSISLEQYTMLIDGKCSEFYEKFAFD